MSRRQPVDPSQTTGKTRALLEGYLALSGALGNRRLSAKLREQSVCEYCLAAHSLLGENAGLGAGEIVAHVAL